MKNQLTPIRISLSSGALSLLLSACVLVLSTTVRAEVAAHADTFRSSMSENTDEVSVPASFSIDKQFVSDTSMSVPQSLWTGSSSEAQFRSTDDLVVQASLRQLAQTGRRRSSNISSYGLTQVGFFLARDRAENLGVRAGVSRLSSNASAGLELVVNW